MVFLNDNPCVVVTGSSGSRHCSIIHHAALQLAQQGYDIQLAAKQSHIVKKIKYLYSMIRSVKEKYFMNVSSYEKTHIKKLKDILQLVEK